jgi:plasmid stabilization system protein ParE
LGAAFAAESRAAVDHVLEHPYSGAPGEAGTRRKLLQRFPYSLIYLMEGEDEHIFIVAVMHQRRKPGYWRDRL